MRLLTKSIYGLETDAKKTPFGLLNNQIKTDSIVNNGGWYNGISQKLGSGDLTIKDLYKISKEIPKEEIFVVLSEFDSVWGIPTSLDASEPGRDYIAQNCMWIVNAGLITRIKTDNIASEDVECDGVKYKKISRATMYKSIKYDPAKPLSKTISPPKNLDKVKQTTKSTATISKKNLATVSQILQKYGYTTTPVVKVKP